MIKGKIHALAADIRVHSMPIGIVGYLHPGDIILTRKALFLDKYSSVHMREELKQSEVKLYIPIKRLSAGCTGNDFELDFESRQKYDITLISESVYVRVMECTDQYVVFTGFELDVMDFVTIPGVAPKVPVAKTVPAKSANKKSNPSNAVLTKRMNEAAGNGDFEKAGKYRDQLKERGVVFEEKPKE